MSRWDDLTMTQRSELINLYLRGGVLDLQRMRDHYNTYDDGGPMGSLPEEPSIASDATYVARPLQPLIIVEEDQVPQKEYPVLRADTRSPFQRELDKKYTEERKRQEAWNDMLYDNQHVWMIDPTRRITRDNIESEYQYQKEIGNTITGALTDYHLTRAAKPTIAAIKSISKQVVEEAPISLMRAASAYQTVSRRLPSLVSKNRMSFRDVKDGIDYAAALKYNNPNITWDMLIPRDKKQIRAAFISQNNAFKRAVNKALRTQHQYLPKGSESLNRIKKNIGTQKYGMNHDMPYDAEGIYIPGDAESILVTRNVGHTLLPNGVLQGNLLHEFGHGVVERVKPHIKNAKSIKDTYTRNKNYFRSEWETLPDEAMSEGYSKYQFGKSKNQVLDYLEKRMLKPSTPQKVVDELRMVWSNMLNDMNIIK